MNVPLSPLTEELSTSMFTFELLEFVIVIDGSLNSLEFYVHSLYLSEGCLIIVIIIYAT